MLDDKGIISLIERTHWFALNIFAALARLDLHLGVIVVHLFFPKVTKSVSMANETHHD
jgi:hypothetical protein